MFSFHKPKIYRSNLGCCICKAKSSSSRFTDSKKYENEFERCFRIQEKRSGEICNACVLLVKRWKKLSPDNRLTKHWHHVVDARAGPGTKITGNRRVTGGQSSHHHNQSSHDSTSSRSQKGSGKSEVLPLSSSQANNQASSSGNSTRGRASSLSKARAIDTNVSTFTFGEPPSAYRRSYMSSESHSSYMSYNAGLSSPKPQSALSSSAFESVIKRFRQRQQQQQLESQRRQLNRLERQKLRQANRANTSASSSSSSSSGNADTSKSSLPNTSSSSTGQSDSISSDDSPHSGHSSSPSPPRPTATTASCPPVKRVKRNSENHGSLEALKISSVLDGSIWRREKVCCGIIFRGLFNEVAVFPKLLKPCDYRLMKAGKPVDRTPGQHDTSGELASDAGDLLEKVDEPPPRATKSGSISSCDSSTSGTGSMEPTLEEIKRSNRDHNDPSPAVRPRTVPTTKRRRQPKEDVESTSTSGASTLSSGNGRGAKMVDSPSGSDESSSRMMLLVDGCEMVEDDDEDELVLAEEEDVELDEEEEEECESSNDATSSVDESLVEMDTKKSSTVA